MKKIYFLLIAALLVGMAAVAQKRAVPERKGFLILSAGPSLPLGDFKAKNIDNNNAGFARTGFNMNLQGGYHFVKNVGVTGSVFYSLYSFDEMKLKELLINEGASGDVVINADHWKYYGITAGPILTWDLSPKTFVDFNVMTGIVRANSPKGNLNVEAISAQLSEDWATAIPLSMSGGLRFQLGQNGYFATGVNYFYINPEFKYKSSGQIIDRAHQRISALNLTAGFGIGF